MKKQRKRKINGGEKKTVSGLNRTKSEKFTLHHYIIVIHLYSFQILELVTKCAMVVFFKDKEDHEISMTYRRFGTIK